MAKAFKCDRCKRLYELPQDGHEFEIWDCKNSHSTLDLCPACNEELEKWMHVGTDKEKKTDEEKDDIDKWLNFARSHAACFHSSIEADGVGMFYKCHHVDNKTPYCDYNLCPLTEDRKEECRKQTERKKTDG